MARILTISPERAKGGLRLVLPIGKRKYGYVSGITQILLPDLMVARAANMMYNRLHLGKSSETSRLQREMLATVVNGIT
jgi:hypothetical protein